MKTFITRKLSNMDYMFGVFWNPEEKRFGMISKNKPHKHIKEADKEIMKIAEKYNALPAIFPTYNDVGEQDKGLKKTEAMNFRKNKYKPKEQRRATKETIKLDYDEIYTTHVRLIDVEKYYDFLAKNGWSSKEQIMKGTKLRAKRYEVVRRWCLREDITVKQGNFYQLQTPSNSLEYWIG